MDLKRYLPLLAAITTVAIGGAVAYASDDFLDRGFQPIGLKGPDGGAVAQKGTAEGAAHVAVVAHAGQGGAVTLTAGIIPVDGGFLPATQIPAADAGYSDRTELLVQNLGASEIWCGYSAATNSTTGLRVDGSPDGVHAGGIFQTDVIAPVYCWSQAGQTAPANTRWTESR